MTLNDRPLDDTMDHTMDHTMDDTHPITGPGAAQVDSTCLVRRRSSDVAT